ncbi:ATP-binding protein [Solihabitans fulvus]|uniref:ATP-binding protein n=1 Tax=Solihabitans fulvus TaxID=1892852 RepID=A0A5B2WBX1_9PSEU|nr:ATP-binding protein [Solihabitans fulvus]
MTSAKIVVAGGYGAGKAAFVGSIADSDLMSCTMLPPDGAGLGDPASLEFGRVWLDPTLILYLFCTPQRPGLGWDDVARGAIGAVVLVNPRRPLDSVDAAGFFADRGVPFVLASHGESGRRHDLDGVRQAVTGGARVPVVHCDTRDRRLVKNTLVSLVEHAKASRVLCP